MIGNGWDEILPREETLAALAAAEEDGKGHTVYPPREKIFAALRLTPPEAARVVILGQDPYHEPGQAQGLAFSVPDGMALPPSLRNIFRELEYDLGKPAPKSGDLTFWAEQGVLLLNTVLTVRRGEANSHKGIGWQAVTDEVIRGIGSFPQPVAFLLWGTQAGRFAPVAALSPHPRLILTGPHPSPLSAHRGFFGSRPFSKINDFLTKNGQSAICWTK